MGNSFYDIAMQAADINRNSSDAQRVLIDNFTADSPILSGMPFEKASNNYSHIYSRVVGASGIDVVDLDGILPDIGSSSQLERVDLTKLGGKIVFGQDKAIAYGGKDNYLTKQLPAALRKSGQSIETSFYINNFLGKTVEYNTAFSATSSPDVGGTSFGTMVAVTWTPGEVTGLFSPLPYGNGRVFETQYLNGGNVYADATGRIVYGAYVQTLIGLLLANKQRIASLVNITALPTAKQLAGLVNAAGANGNTRIYTSPSLRTSLAAGFAQSMQGNGLVSVTSAGDVAILGVPVVTSFNVPSASGYIAAPYIGA